MYFFKGNTRSGFNSFFFLKKVPTIPHICSFYIEYWNVLFKKYNLHIGFHLASAIALLPTYGFKNQWNWKFEMQLHYSSHHPPISSSDLTLSFICRTTCTICLRVAARFMQCGKDYPPCLHALFYLHTHDVLTNLVNCIFCRRPQKWWAARKELVASEQKKSRLLDSKSGFHKSTTYTSKPPFSLYMGTKVHAVWHSQPNAADTIFWYCRNSIGWWLVIGVFFWGLEVQMGLARHDQMSMYIW